MDERVIIVGAGEAGVQVAVSLRERRFAGDIVLIGDEPHLPYRRPPLSKTFLKEEVSADSMQIRPRAFYDTNRIELRLGDTLQSVDRAGRTVRLGSGHTLCYDQLVLALGARNRPLPAADMTLANLHMVRTRDDAEALRDQLTEGGKLVIVGAGFIGLEIAATARAKGMDVHIVEAAERVMGRAVSSEMSAFFLDAHRAMGSTVSLGTSVAGLMQDSGRAVGVALVDGRVLPADTVVVGIGVIANAEPAEQAGLEVDQGILVNRFLETSDPSISAIGDCARFPHPDHPKPVRIESVQNALDQARCVAARLTGTRLAYASLPWFWSDQGALKLQIAGLAQGCDEVVVTGEPSSGSFSVLCFRSGRLLAVESVNRPADHMAARRLLSSGKMLAPAMASMSGFSLKSYLAGLADARPLASA